MSARKVMIWYAVAMAALVAGFFAVPVLRTVLIAAVGVVGAAAVTYGVHLHHPRRGYSWHLLAAGLLVLAAGDTARYVTQNLSPGPSGPVSALAPHICYLLSVPLIGAGLLGLTRGNAVARDRAGLLDSLIFTTAAAFLLWVFLISPHLAAQRLTSFERSTLAGYLLADVLVVAVMVRLTAAARGNPATIMLLTGAVGLFAADLLYSAALVAGDWHRGGPVALGWFALYLTWGAAALHPSMARLTEPAEPRHAEVSRPRLVLLGLAAVLAPAVLLIKLAVGQVPEAAVVAVVSVLTFMLVLSRLADAADAHRRVVARERSLRTAGAALVSAANADEVSRAVRDAVGQLLPPDAAHRIVFTVNQAVSARPMPSGRNVMGMSTSIWGPTIAAAAEFPGKLSAEAVRRTRVLPARTLPPALAAQLRDFDSAVLCPLVLDDRAAGVPRVGALLVAVDDAALPALRDALEVLAAQVALALERIGLSQEISRRDSEEYFRSLVQHTADVILILEDDDQIRYASPSVTAVLGVEPAACTRLRAVVHPDDQASVSALLDSVRRPRPAGQGPGAERPTTERPATERPEAEWAGGQWREWSVRRADGERVHLEVSCRDLRQDRAVRGLVITMRDVTERRRLEQELTHRAAHDTLTGLANRACFQDRVHEAVEQARASGRTVGTLCIDLDEFSAINDSHGHPVGDALLVEIGHRLRSVVDPSATAARLSGDEFAVLVPDADQPWYPDRVAEKLVAALAQPFVVGDTTLTISVSIGVATTADATDAGELLQRADLALYVAKTAGKGRWCRYQSTLHTAIVERLELRAALAAAVDQCDFSVEYQPIVDLVSGVAVGFEALARWKHPVRGLVPPEQFIALAEETGLIEPIGEWVLQQALATAADWHQSAVGGTAPYVSVNVSVRQLRTPGFVPKVRAALAAAGVPPPQVMLEITESLLLRDDEQVLAELTELRALGVRVAIDDFGTGFSSLSYLQQMPVDVIKIDKSFTATVGSSRRQLLLLEGIVRLADTLGLDIIVEGVETEVARRLLTDMGCASGQGFLFSRPLSDIEARRWLRNGRKKVPAQRAAR